MLSIHNTWTEKTLLSTLWDISFDKKKKNAQHLFIFI